MGPAEKVTAGLDAAEDTGTGRLRREAIAAVVTTRAPQRTPAQPCADCPEQATAGRGRPAVPRRVAFWLVALVLAATMMGTTLPTPLYVIYQAQWHFSAAMVTVTFAVYAAGVLAALLLDRSAGLSVGWMSAYRCDWPAGRARMLAPAE